MFDIYNKAFIDGGLAFSQILVLFEESEKRIIAKMKFDAAIQGIDLDKDSKKKEKNGLGMMFPHPDEVGDLTEKERNDNAEKQMNFHKKILPNQTRLGA